MRTAIYNAILRCIIMWQIFICSIFIIKCKKKDFHTRPSGLLDQCSDIFPDNTKIFGNDRSSFRCFFDHFGQLFARSFFPFTIDRSPAVCRDRPVIYNSNKMINADHIVQIRIRTHSLIPPCKTCVFHFLPVIDGIAPQLSIFAKAVRGHSGYMNRLLSLV